MMDRKRTHAEWADINIDRYERCKNRLLNRDYRPGEAPMLLLQCYRNLYGAEINYLDANIPGIEFRQFGYRECKRLRLNFAAVIEDLMGRSAYNLDVGPLVMQALTSTAPMGRDNGC